MDSEPRELLPKSLQLWIETEAETRAEARYQAILKKNGNAASKTPASPQ